MKFIKGAFVFYNDKPEMGGQARGPVVDIKEKYKDDKGLLEHELMHVKQWYFCLVMSVLIAVPLFLACLISGNFALAIVWVGLLMHQFLYKVFPSYRLYTEIQCYRKQIGCYPAGTSIEFAVHALTTKYDLKLTRQRAVELLKK